MPRACPKALGPAPGRQNLSGKETNLVEEEAELLGFTLHLVSEQQAADGCCIGAERRERSCHQDIGVRREWLKISEHAGHAEIFGERIVQGRTRQNARKALAGGCCGFLFLGGDLLCFGLFAVAQDGTRVGGCP